MNKLIQLKRILNTFKDKELENYELWIDNDTGVDLIVIDDENICLVTDKNNLKINDMQW